MASDVHGDVCSNCPGFEAPDVKALSTPNWLWVRTRMHQDSLVDLPMNLTHVSERVPPSTTGWVPGMWGRNPLHKDANLPGRSTYTRVLGLRVLTCPQL